MLPGINPKQMERMMKQMGIKQTPIEASEVIIRCEGKDLVIFNPEVSMVDMMGQRTFQVTGKAQERAHDTRPEITEEDISTVMSQAKVSEEKARQALEDSDGDIAQAIISLSS